MDQTESKATGTRVLRYVICIILCFLSIIPFYILLINSTLKSSDILTGIKLVPGSQFITNFKGLLEGGAKTSGVNVLQAMLNSLIITVPATALQIYFGSLTAYAVTVYNFKAKNFAWGFIYAIMMIPQQVSIVGFIKICNLTHIYGSYLAMIIPAIAAPTTVYFMKQYMETGLSVEPAMATQAIFGFVASWNNLYTPSIILATERKKQTMPMYVQALKANDKSRDWGQIYCGLFTTVIPILVMYFFLSKYIIAGVVAGAVKS
mgnify:CR=1 FL=1